MADFETICNDEKAWVRYTDGDEGDICIYKRCPECGKYIKEGKLFTNMGGHVKLEGWICKTHGEVEPFWTRD